VEVVTQTHISGLEGEDGMLDAVRWRHGKSKEEVRRPIRHLFLFIGAEPNTTWLSGSGVALDAKGFVLTGGDDGRRPLETSRRGIFAIGMSGRILSSVSPRLSARARRLWQFCMPFWLGPTRRRPQPLRETWLMMRLLTALGATND